MTVAIDAVIFDMDGVLIDSEPYWRKAGAKAFQEIGLPISEKDFAKSMGLRIDHVVNYWFEKYLLKNRSKKHIEEKILKIVLKYIKNEGKLIKGAITALKKCKNINIKIGLASSTPLFMIKKILSNFQIDKYFDAVHSAEFEKKGKPDPSVFLTTSKKLKTEPKTCLVIEDSPVGVIGAKRAGMKCIAIPNPHHRNDKRYKQADIILKNLTEFQKIQLDAIH